MTKALHRSIYTRDMDLWKLTDQISKITDISVSRIVEEALRTHLTMIVGSLNASQVEKLNEMAKESRESEPVNVTTLPR